MRNKREKYSVQMPLTSLIDIVFLLLIYFLLTTNFLVDEGINIKLPKAKATKPQVEEDITVYVSKVGKIFVGKKEFQEGELYNFLKDKISKNKNKFVVVKSDRNAIVQRAVKVMDIAKAAGAEKLCLATEK